MKKIITLIFAALLNCQAAYGEENRGTTGNTMYGVCTHENARGLCDHYYRGLWDGMFAGSDAILMHRTNNKDVFTLRLNKPTSASELLGICADSNVIYEQAIDIAVNWLKNNPEKRHEQAGLLAYQAWREAFPCNE